MLLLINAVNTTSNYFRIIGDASIGITAGSYIQVLQSTGNNGLYQIASSVYSGGYTTLTVTTSIPNGTVDGVIAGGVYSLSFTQSAITGKADRIVAPYGIDTSTSLTLFGKASLNFGAGLQKNILGLLDNFASTTAPANPTIGQHWFDYTNKVTKTYVDGSTWSTDINVEGGVISFKDPQHTTPGTKYFLTASEAAGVTGAGVTLYPAINPAAGQSMFRACDAAGVPYFTVEFSGNTTSKNPLNVTATTLSSFAGPQTLNTSNSGTIGLTVSKNIVASGGDIVVDATKAIKVVGGSSVTLGTTVALRGTATAGGVICMSTTGTTVATFADASIVFAQPTTIPTLSSTSTSTGSLTVTGSTTLAATSVTTLTATGAATLAATSVTTLTASSTSTLATANVTTLGVTGTTTLATANVTTLGVTGTTTLATANVTTLSVSGTASLTNMTVSGTATCQTPTLGGQVTNKTYVDGLIATKEPTITAGLSTQYWAGDKTWKTTPVTREILTANRTYYVRADGSDSNTGLSNIAGGAFLTVQKAVDIITTTLDISTYTVTIQVNTGTYTTPVVLKDYVGVGSVILQGDTTTPTNVVINTTSNNAVTNSSGRTYTVQGFKLQTTTSGIALACSSAGSKVLFNKIDFGTSSGGTHIGALSGGEVVANGVYTISGPAAHHLYAIDSGIVTIVGQTVTISGTPAFSTAFAYARTTGALNVYSTTFGGTVATGVRYSLTLNGVCFVSGGAATYLPGDTAGTITLGGQYG